MRFLIGIALVFIALRVQSQNVTISLFHNQKVEAFLFTAHSGKYDIIIDNSIEKSIDAGTTIEFTIKNNRIHFGKKSAPITATIFLRGIFDVCYFTITHSSRRLPQRSYDNDLYVSVSQNNFRLINDVNFEKYIAGVVEAEGGPRAPFEYYKAQAILCRTYAAKYYTKHLDEGFNLCDEVHCQAYKGRCTHNPAILTAAYETAGLIVVDSTNTPISATYFANSGGQTANSEDVWINAVPYLRSVKDTFSIGMPGYTWQREIPLQDWKKYLQEKGFDVSPMQAYEPYTVHKKYDRECSLMFMHDDALLHKQQLHSKHIYSYSILQEYNITDKAYETEQTITLPTHDIWKPDTLFHSIQCMYTPQYDSVFNVKEQVHYPLDFTFTQNDRLRFFSFRGDDSTLRLRTIRYDWLLRSSFFSTHTINDTLIISGKGYGHGVGLSQEGAMNMALQGYSYDKIITFYFKNVQIIPVRTLDFYTIE